MFYRFFGKVTASGAVKSEVMQNKELAEEYTEQLLENLKNEKYTHLL